MSSAGRILGADQAKLGAPELALPFLGRASCGQDASPDRGSARPTLPAVDKRLGEPGRDIAPASRRTPLEAKKSLPAGILEGHARQPSGGPWPPWQLIATDVKLEIAITRSRQRTSHFLIATKTDFSHSEFCTTNRDPSDLKRSRSEGDLSGEIPILPRGRDNFSRSSAIESLGASGVPEVYNPGRFLRRYP